MSQFQLIIHKVCEVAKLHDYVLKTWYLMYHHQQHYNPQYTSAS